MAFRNKVLINPVTGQSIRFLQTASGTNGALLELETTYNAASKEPPPHYHPHQEEEFTVLEGRIAVKLNGTMRHLNAGDTLHIAKNEVHAMWNDSSQKAVVNWKVRPALDTESFLETGFGLATDGKVGTNGMPSFLQAALLADKFSEEFRLSRPAFAVQKILFSILKPFAYLKGYRPTYTEYLD